MPPREEPHLRLPVAVVAGEFVAEQDRRAAAGLLVIEPDVVAGGGVGHVISSIFLMAAGWERKSARQSSSNGRPT